MLLYMASHTPTPTVMWFRAGAGEAAGGEEVCVGLHPTTGLQQLQDLHRNSRVLPGCLH